MYRNVNSDFKNSLNTAYEMGITGMDVPITQKQTTLIKDYVGNINKNEGMGYLVNKYNAKTTGKEIITNNSEYSGNANSKDKQSTVRTTFENPEYFIILDKLYEKDFKIKPKGVYVSSLILNQKNISSILVFPTSAGNEYKTYYAPGY